MIILYPKWFIQKVLKKRKVQAQVKLKEKQRHVGLVVLPFISGINEIEASFEKPSNQRGNKTVRHYGKHATKFLKDKINKFNQRSVVQGVFRK